MTAPTPLSSLSSALADVVTRTAPSVVAVHSHRSRATGFVWKPGLIVTADEALADEGDIQISLPDGSNAAATIVGRDHTTDIALLRTDASLAPVKLAATVPPLGTLSVVVATDRDAPSAAQTQRELDVLALMAEGASNKLIARQLGISVHTVKFHVGSLLDKLDATGSTDAVAHAARRGVIEL
ncbi:LuxR C-terminal-related transcriptional regulator [Bradyrhizobium barranii subsp. apii]|uniref:LuxR C-terminal-related transcriptional regulator n=1 Tax=Bradyrhizobium barranii subsp. apii TaxID=2819348 RepID=A0A8T5V0D4_9BRAD|nr:LuxR C-terminal-related transcriptional regulator [Bradyrhizobium barranii]UPT86269.1 LuxR C-terminal-related transcriptional regulator [Bradyrhizobium barranii subsp. apii]